MFDDAFWEGDVLNLVPTSQKGQGVKEMLDYVETRPEMQTCFVPMFAGVFVIVRI